MMMDSSSSAGASSSSSSSPVLQYRFDVFISFRGTDTRCNFTSHLYYALCKRKIRTFIDDKIKRGYPISTLFSIIESSRIAVVVFSNDYASSKWCLDELVKIQECKEKYGQIVIPVFYNIAPSDVRNQTGSYVKSFDEHGLKQTPETIQKWRNALRETCLLAGWESAVTSPDSYLLEKIVKDVLEKLDQILPTDNNSLVGIDSKVQEIISWLCIGSRDLRSVGIWGIGGIGKTTLAKAVFNKIRVNFDGAYFIPLPSGEGNVNIDNIRLDYSDIRYPRKLLVVFDNVTHPLQIEDLIGFPGNWSNTGSRFIMTTRNKQVLQLLCEGKIYKLLGLLGHEALQLFSQYAFKPESSLAEYIELSMEIVECTKGIPLALKILGSSLLGKDKQTWKSAIQKLQANPVQPIQATLQISYDRLDEDQKRIFLDIVCFFDDDIDFDRLVEYFDACGFCALTDLDILVDNCLIQHIWGGVYIHDLIRSMGREIVRKESRDPGKRSRLWHHKDIYHILRNNTGTDRIEGISLGMSNIDDIYLQKNTFKKMKNLRYLRFSRIGRGYVNKVHIPQDIDFSLKELRYLRWDGCPLKSLQLINWENLVMLEIRDSKIEQLWEDIQPPIKLRRMSLWCCYKLAAIPNMSGAKCLEILKVNDCPCLRSLPDDICELKSLCIRNCENFNGLHASICKLKSLSQFDVSCNKKLVRLPDDIGNLEALQNLNALETAIEVLPSSICKLKSLSHLDVSRNRKLVRLPDDIGNLEALQYLDASETAIEVLPSSICKLKSLSQLDVSRNRKLVRLPDDIGNLEDLRTLYAGGTAIEEVPSSIGSLSRLVILSLSDAKLKFLPHNICNLKSLTCLYLEDNKEFERLPHDLWKLEALERLIVSGTSIEEVPMSVRHLSRLQELDLSNCSKLKYLPRSIFELDPHYSFHEETSIILTGCCNIDCKIPMEIVEDAINATSSILPKPKDPRAVTTIIYLGVGIPEFFCVQNNIPSVKLKLPSGFCNSEVVRFCLATFISLPRLCLGVRWKLNYRDGNSQVGTSSVSLPRACYGKLLCGCDETSLEPVEKTDIARDNQFSCINCGHHARYRLFVFRE